MGKDGRWGRRHGGLKARAASRGIAHSQRAIQGVLAGGPRGVDERGCPTLAPAMVLARQSVRTSTPEPLSWPGVGRPGCEADPAGVRKVKCAQPARMRENRWALPETAYASEQFQFALVVALS
jgi:hypothetical protein